MWILMRRRVIWANFKTAVHHTQSARTPNLVRRIEVVKLQPLLEVTVVKEVQYLNVSRKEATVLLSRLETNLSLHLPRLVEQENKRY